MHLQVVACTSLDSKVMAQTTTQFRTTVHRETDGSALHLLLETELDAHLQRSCRRYGSDLPERGLLRVSLVPRIAES